MTAKTITNRLAHDMRRFIWINTLLISLVASATFLFYLESTVMSAMILILGIFVGVANHFFIFNYYSKRTEIELNTSFEEFQDEMNFDELTRVYNRKAGTIRFREELERAKRNGEKLSIAIIDADNFKSINDTYGHLAGDEVLRVIAATIKSKLRTNDIVFRYGGEEFIIIMPETDEYAASIPLERLREKLSDMVIRFEDHEIQTSVSIGVTEVYDKKENESSLIGRADSALYRAKNTGKNRIVYHTSLEEFPVGAAVVH